MCMFSLTGMPPHGEGRYEGSFQQVHIWLESLDNVTKNALKNWEQIPYNWVLWDESWDALSSPVSGVSLVILSTRVMILWVLNTFPFNLKHSEACTASVQGIQASTRLLDQWFAYLRQSFKDLRIKPCLGLAGLL
jgi:hypothetical protein